MNNLLTVKKVAEILNSSTDSIYRWVDTEKISYIRLPSGSIRFDSQEIEGWVNRGRKEDRREK